MHVCRFRFRFVKRCLRCGFGCWGAGVGGTVDGGTVLRLSVGGFFTESCLLYKSGSSHVNFSGFLGNGDLAVCAYIVITPSSSRSGKHAVLGEAMETTLTVGHLNQTTTIFL